MGSHVLIGNIGQEVIIHAGLKLVKSTRIIMSPDRTKY